MSGGGGETAQAPDMTWANTQWGDQLSSAKQNMASALQWAQEHGTSLDEALKQVQPQTFAAGNQMMGVGGQLMQKYMDQYGPLQKAQADYAMDYASPTRIAQAMGQAGAGVSDAFKAAGDTANRNLERFGVDPSVGRGGALDLGVQLSEATAKAGAMDTARRATETTGQQLINQAIGTGQNIANTGVQATSTGAQTGATGINEGTSTVATQSPMLGNALGWFGGGNQALGGFVNTTQGEFQDQSQNAAIRNQASNANSAGIGSLLGTGASMAMMFAADGGTVPEPGSAVPLSASPSRGAVEDDVSARVEPGEFIMPKDVVAWKGEEWHQKQIKKAREDMRHPDGKPAKPELKPAINLPPTYRSPGTLHGQAVPMGA